MRIYNGFTLPRKALIMVLGMMLLATAVVAQNIGDYKTKYGGTQFSSAAGWQIYTSSGWTNATSAPASPFNHDLYIDRMSTIDLDFHLTGNMIMGANGSLFIASDKKLEIGSNAQLLLSKITVNGRGKLLNRGSIRSAVPGAQLILDPAGTVGAVLENYGLIELQDDNNDRTYNLNMNSYARLISGDGARIIGDGSASSNASGVYFEIANTGGFDEAMQLQGPNAFNPAHYLFNGTSDQVCGVNLPDPVFSITVANPAKFYLNKDIALNPWQHAYFHIMEGSTVDMGTHIIHSENWGNASFKLDTGATILTAHPEGISSEVMYQKIYLGCIQTNDATYSSGANYGYNGTEPQVSGNFVTTPASNTINDLIVSNTSGLTLTNPLDVQGTIYGAENIEGSDTLPVTLSAFSAFVGNDTKVRVFWTTESETNCYGYYVHRNTVNDLSKAELISGLIMANNSSQGGTYEFQDYELDYDGVVYYWLEDVSFDGKATYHGPVQVYATSGSNQGTPPTPAQTRIESIYPNPFNPSTTIRYQLEKQADVNITVYNIKGQLIDMIYRPAQAKGQHSYVWNAAKASLPSGVYFVRFTSGMVSEIRKVVLTK